MKPHNSLIVLMLACMSLLNSVSWASSNVGLVHNNSPLLIEPRFAFLDTRHGLTQDSITDSVVDSAGYLWVGTPTGLNRYDGHQLLIIEGPNNEFNEMPIWKLHFDAQHHLWVSVKDAGVYRFNTLTGEITQVVNAVVENAPGSLQNKAQNAVAFIESAQYIDIIFEKQVQRVDKLSGESQLVFALQDLPETLNQYRNSRLRHAININHNWLFATTQGVLGFNAQKNIIKAIEYVSPTNQNIDNINAKYLYRHELTNQILIATVEGLYAVDAAQTLSMLNGMQRTPEYAEILPNRNIWHITAAKDSVELLYIATDQGLYQWNLFDDDMTWLFAPSSGQKALASHDIKSISLDNKGNLWLGTQMAGMLYWSPNSLLFENYYNSRLRPDHKILPNNIVWSFLEYQGTLYVGTQNGLAKVDLKTQHAEHFLQSTGPQRSYSRSTINQIFPGHDERTLWLVTNQGLVIFDTVTGEDITSSHPHSAQLNEAWIFGAYKADNGILWFASPSELFALSADRVQRFKFDLLDDGLNLGAGDFHAVIGADPSHPGQVLVALTNALYRFDPQTQTMSLVHQLPVDTNKAFYADSVVIDDQGRMWVTYPAYGVVAIDMASGEQVLHLSKQNGLSNNTVFGLQRDETGDIWFSSHAGLHKIEQQTLQVMSFHYSNGLSNMEFNQGAATVLSDGRFVYGSPRGFTLFDPRLVSQATTTPDKAVVTSISVNGRSQPLLNYDVTRHVQLAHDDVGVTLHFSTLNYAFNHSQAYDYALYHNGELKLSGSTQTPKVMFPQLDSGSYAFYVQPRGYSGNNNNLQSNHPPALSMTVSYSAYNSPFAWGLYGLTAIFLCSILLISRHNKALAEQQANNDLLTIKNRLTNAMRASNSYIWEYCPQQNKMLADRFSSELGYQLDDGVPFDLFVSMIHRRDTAKFLHAWNAFIDNNHEALDVTYRIVAKSGEALWYRDLGNYMELTSGTGNVVTGTYTNITTNIVEQERGKLFGDAFENTTDWVMILGRSGKFVAANPAFAKTFDVKPDFDLTTQIYQRFAHDSKNRDRLTEIVSSLKPSESYKNEVQLALPNGTVVDVLINVTAIENSYEKDKIDNYLIILTDISEQKRAERKLQEIANYDNLTGLANRTLLLQRLEHSLMQSLRHRTKLAVFFIDLDRFKPINDSYGHEAGDNVLREVAKRLSAMFRSNDTVARLGGDEFVVTVEDVNDVASLPIVLEKIIHTLEQPITILNDISVSVNASIGVAVFPDDSNDADSLLRCADIAMYYSKEDVNKAYYFYTAEMNTKAREHLVLQNSIKFGQANDQFVNHYQAIYDIQQNYVIGFELLMRWDDGAQLVSPGKFIPVAEEIGMIVDMTRDAIKRGLQDMSEWREQGFDGYLSVNLSARHFENQFNLDEIIDWIEALALPRECLRFEITEGVLMKDANEALVNMNNINNAGFKIALDDFGTGFSSLRYLKDFPFEIIKIDKSFVDGIGVDKNDEVIILTTLAMAQNLGMQCIAEGIETEEQIEFFMQNNCPYLQGFYFSKPVNHSDTLTYLQEQTELTQEIFQFFGVDDYDGIFSFDEDKKDTMTVAQGSDNNVTT